MDSFRCGRSAVPAGVTEFSVAAALPFSPTHVLVSVRQPAEDAPLVSAYVTGTPSENSFSVALSAPVEGEGYVLEWTAFSSDNPPSIAGDTLSESYETLKVAVARYIGWNPSSLTEQQLARVDACIQSGVRRFYYPPAMEGVDVGFEWSFLRQAGSILVTAGTDNYVLPDGFGRIAGQLMVSGKFGPTIPVIPYGDIMSMRRRGDRGRPRFAATVALQSFGTRGQEKRIYFYPCPDEDMVIEFACDADTGKIDPETRPFPLGGPMFAELVRESCLSVAEQDVNDASEIHTQNFHELLVAMISRDRKSGAQNFGPVGDKGVGRIDPFPYIRHP